MALKRHRWRRSVNLAEWLAALDIQRSSPESDMTTAARAGAFGANLTPHSDAVPTSDRLEVLDILRGIALLGMFFVHFSDWSEATTGGVGKLYGQFVSLFFSARFWAMFAILFGVGFAVQLASAERRGDRFWPHYLRRAGTLFIFGFVAEAFFGFNVLIAYAVWGVVLIFVHRWSTRALVVLLVLCLSARLPYGLIYGGYMEATQGPGAFLKARQADAAHGRALNAGITEAKESGSYRALVDGRIARMPWSYSQPFAFLPFNNFALLLIGFLAYRLGVFDRTREKQKLIIGCMVFGIASWAISHWLIPFKISNPNPPETPLFRWIIMGNVANAFWLLRDMWLTFTYMGAVVLLVTFRPVWLRRLAPLGWTGRMALTNYFIQIILIDVTFQNYGFGAKLSATWAPLAAIALFGLTAAISRWWLARFRYGPLEWIWRSATYARVQPLKIGGAAA